VSISFRWRGGFGWIDGRKGIGGHAAAAPLSDRCMRTGRAGSLPPRPQTITKELGGLLVVPRARLDNGLDEWPIWIPASTEAFRNCLPSHGGRFFQVTYAYVVLVENRAKRASKIVRLLVGPA
jgi:hypothetical protein